ncbi:MULTISPECIES: DUF3549 family protein [unclassified Halomonas]|uniref:DUF3549 family protein n=1 Tax=unclassified Halomonas TaxID=2609666 RepID=UPI0020A1B2D1|nr:MULTISPECIES: DUF3549 family protein [unclassified Halomonas]MCP1313578.1 DUF3549 family protein [Halomonas sp. 707D7]MCP1326188.1 DUF3549 family protein [Halomonas sp. 707D4]
MQALNTLGEFFERSGAEVALYHMGRRVAPCRSETLAGFERGEQPWPEPWQGQARIAALFRIGDMAEPAVWFLALPLDEQGLLSPASRDGFLNRLVETLGRNVATLGQGEAARVEHFMQDNPLAFTPSLPFQAMLNARATADQNLPASQHFEPVEAYLSGQQSIDWQALGLQGVADFAVRSDAAAQDTLARLIGEERFDAEVIRALCLCFEHCTPSDALVTALIDRGERAAHAGDVETLCACVRGVGASPLAAVGAWYQSLLEDTDACGPDLLAAIAGRGWTLLEDATRLPLFLTRLAERPDANFAGVVRDIALIPRLRLLVLMTLRDAPEGGAIHARLANIAPRH